MDNQNNKSQFPEMNGNNNNSGEEMNKNQEQSTGSGSYYYSYGPFQSIDKQYTSDSNNNSDQTDVPMQKDVEITPPQPVKPVPMMNSYRPTNNLPGPQPGTGGAGGGSKGTNGGNGGNWNFNHRPKSSFKSNMISFIAGMVVIAILMFTADRANLFTPDSAAVSTAPASSTASSLKDESGEAAPAKTTSLPLNSTGDVSTVVTEAGPAVVKIDTLVKSGKSNSGSSRYYDDPFWQYFFGDSYGGSGRSGSTDSSTSTDQLVPYGIGTGFIYDQEGYILTNEHVIGGADVIQVTLEDSTKPYEAKLLGSSKDLDLAVLKIEREGGFPVVPLGDSESVKVGEAVVAIGNPKGMDHTVTAGVLSARERSISIDDTDGTRNYEHLLQTDASINPGNSGGPLLNLKGEVIGMNVAVSADAQGIGFAIPTETIKEVLDKLENNQEIPKAPVPFIGASLMTLTDEVAKQMGTDITEGSVVAEVVYKSPAYVADVRPYDIITGVNGTPYATNQELIAFIQSQEVGTEITLNIVRDGNKLDLKLNIGDKNQFNIE